MRGTIKYVAKDEQYKFRGAISGEDGTTYKFNSANWNNANIALEDLWEGQTVEFELKAPNRAGFVYPKSIRFPGEPVEGPIQKNHDQVAHSFGRFNDFVFVKTESIAMALEQIVENFEGSEYASNSRLYKKIATTFNALRDEDFHFSGSENVIFPMGFSTASGQQVFLYCTPNRGNSSIPWYSESVYVDGDTFGQSVFNFINANWYDVEDAINEILPDNKETVFEIIRKIEKRCIDINDSIISLKKGKESSWDEADELYVPTDFFENGGKEIYLLCLRRNGPRGFGWYLSTATYEGAPITVFEKKTWIEKWSGFMGIDIFIQLAAQTLEEQWSFGNKSDYGILKNYLRYTFSHQLANENIGYSPDEKFAAFNTGLPDRNTYKYLYALFEKTEYEKDDILHPLYYCQKYTFKEFVVPGRGGNGKVLSSNIRPLPNPPQYFGARSATVWELDFNDGNEVTTPEYDDIHILIKRCERVPLEFYRFPALQSTRLTEIINSNESLAEKYKGIREYFKPIVDTVPDAEVTNVYRTLSNSLESVINTAVKKLSWNWRAVVPCYNPERNEPCYLLPVSFCDPVKPDRAMIASVNKIEEDDIYTIHTVIPLDWAYLDARLVCRPESEWLAANYIEEEEA